VVALGKRVLDTGRFMEMSVGFGADASWGCGRATGVGVCRDVEGTGARAAICGSPFFFARPGGMQPLEPGEHPHPVFFPWLQPGGVPAFCFQLALPWLNPAGIALNLVCRELAASLVWRAFVAICACRKCVARRECLVGW
jgi:hypothetical protein